MIQKTARKAILYLPAQFVHQYLYMVVILKVSCAFCFTTWHDLGIFFQGFCFRLLFLVRLFDFFFRGRGKRGIRWALEPNRFVYQLIQNFFYFSCFFRLLTEIFHTGTRNHITVHLLSVIQHPAYHLACCLGM